MWNVSDEFLEGLAYSGRMLTKVNLYRGVNLVAENVAISDGSVAVDGNSDVRRALTMTVPDQSLLDLLDPYACDVRVWRGMLFGNNITEWVPQGLFRVWSVDYERPGLGIGVNALDRGAMVADDEFVNPRVSPGSAIVAEEIEGILDDAGYPGLADGVALTDTVGHRMVWDGTRWEAVNALADSLDASVFFDQIGSPILAPDQPGDPVWTVAAGEGGVLVGSNVSVTRDEVFNCVVAEGEHPNGNPIRSVQKDLDADSPTYWNGSFGHAVRKESNQVWNTQDKCDRAATRLLRQSIGKVRTVDLSSVPNPALDAGDVVTVRYVNGAEEDLVIDAFTVPLVGGDFTMTARSKRTLTV